MDFFEDTTLLYFSIVFEKKSFDSNTFAFFKSTSF